MAAPLWRLDEVPSRRRPPVRSLLNTLRVEGLLLGDSAPVDIPPNVEGEGLEGSNAMPRWANGVTWEGEPCGDDGGLYDPCEGATKTITDNGGVVEFAAVTAQSAVSCTSLSRGGVLPDADVARARSLLNVEQHRFVGEEVWSGTLAQAASLPNQWLSNEEGLCQILDGVAVGVVDGLAALEEALYGLGDCGCVPAGQGMIHVDPYTLTLWEASWTIIDSGFPGSANTAGMLRTRLGTIVVTGPGYDGSDPDGVVGATTRWAYATPLMFGALTQPKVLDPAFREMDRDNNQVPVYAERTIAVGWDPCCRVGVEIDLTERC